MSAHLQWMIVHNCLSFLIKRNKQTYSMTVEPAADGKGIIVVLKKHAGGRADRYLCPWSVQMDLNCPVETVIAKGASCGSQGHRKVPG
uniref:Uncharacterized protein n=1 Tax=Pseudonaja textilis TaxID=8673 RepID=A0A670ZFS9_PSETE